MQQCFQQRSQAGLLTAWTRQRTAFLSEAAQQLLAAVQLQADSAAAAAEELVWGLHGELKRQWVAEWKQVCEEQRREEGQQADLRSQQAAEELAVQQAAEAARRAEERAALDLAREQKAAEAAAALAAAREAQAAAEQQAAERIEAGRPAVAARQATALGRLQERRAARRVAEGEAAARQRRLDEATFHPEAEHDSLRVLRPTECSAAEAHAVGRAFAPVTSYTTQQLMRDPRFRLLDALGRAGLRGTEAASRTVAEQQPVRVAR
jgi:hypothetical protein